MSLDKSKTNPTLGAKVHSYLVEKGVETPMIGDVHMSADKIPVIAEAFATIMECMGLDLKDDSLCETPKRIAKMFVNEIYWGLDYNNFPKITTIENQMSYNSMLLERNIKVVSNCEHHFVPIMGTAYVAYIPDEKVIGLSKINRIVEFFCRRPQVQERLIEQIFYTLQYVLETDNIAVLIKAEHSCVKLRGVEDTNSDTITARLGGSFLEIDSLRNEFYHSIEL